MSSAYDQARLIATAAANEHLSEIMRKSSYTTNIGKRVITANSTNQIVRTGDIDVVGGKTGFISRSGYCLATLLRLPQSGQQVAFVVLGAKSNASRFWETRHLFNWMSTQDQGTTRRRLPAATAAGRLVLHLHHRRVERQRRNQIHIRQ